MATVTQQSSRSMAATTPASAAAAAAAARSADEGSISRPRLCATRGWGRQDLQRFDHFSSPAVSVGSRKIRKVTVTCNFLFRKSQWGVFGERSPYTQGGIVYLDVDIRQPDDCRLKSATVTVTLGLESEIGTAGAGSAGGRKGKAGRSPATAADPDDFVRLTAWYGPRQFSGREAVEEVRKVARFEPSVDALGVGGGLGGWEREIYKRRSKRWKFEGHLIRGPHNGIGWRGIRWDLTENPMEAQSVHSNLIHTAFSFEHGGRSPVYMTVEISGKLADFSDRMLRALKVGHSGDQQETITTVMQFDGIQQCQAHLEPVAKRLESVMLWENFKSIVPELTDTMPLAFVDPGRMSTQLTHSHGSADLASATQAAPALESSDGDDATVVGADNAATTTATASWHPPALGPSAGALSSSARRLPIETSGAVEPRLCEDLGHASSSTGTADGVVSVAASPAASRRRTVVSTDRLAREFELLTAAPGQTVPGLVVPGRKTGDTFNAAIAGADPAPQPQTPDRQQPHQQPSSPPSPTPKQANGHHRHPRAPSDRPKRRRRKNENRGQKPAAKPYDNLVEMLLEIWLVQLLMEAVAAMKHMMTDLVEVMVEAGSQKEIYNPSLQTRSSSSSSPSSDSEEDG